MLQRIVSVLLLPAALRFGSCCENLQIGSNRRQGRGAWLAKFPRCKTLREWIILYAELPAFM